MELFKPSYFDRFACLAGACPDSCCQEWAVQVDKASAARYRSLPGALGDRLRQVLQDEDGETIMSIQDGRCPMWRGDGLCRIQAELGEDALCRTCKEFPRLTHDYGDFVELGLELSCPEAARLILSASDAALVAVTVPGGETPDYDRDAMAVLTATRDRVLTILSDRHRPIGESLALALLYGIQAQSALDGGELPPFQPEAALASAKAFAQPGNPEEMLAFFAGLEILTPQWAQLLRTPHPGPWEPAHLALARYLVMRYWLQAVSDFDLYSRVKLIAIACLLVKHLGGDLLRTAQLFSKEIENDADNIDAILDAAYENPAFADVKLLYQLAVEE